ncbi:MAG: PhnD/SsuA/transferrin family substrate-binding protein [Dissulfuribacterales bacterium]
MRINSIAILWFCVLCFFAAFAHAKEVLKLGVLVYEDKNAVQKQYEPVIAALNTELSSIEIQMEVLTQQELNTAVEDETIDLVTTNPVHFFLLSHRYHPLRLLATQIKEINGKATPLLGGVIFTRSDRQDINNLQDLMSRTIACPGRYFLGGFALQAHELLRAGIKITDWARSILELHDHYAVVQAVLNGQADAGFVRTGVLEDLFADGALQPSEIRVINSQHYADFPFLVSTGLYPEWPIAALPHVNDSICNLLTIALLKIKSATPSDKTTSYVAGYTLPLSYEGVKNIVMTLNFPELSPVELFWNDLIHTNKWQAYLIIGGLLLICVLILLLGLALLQTTEERQRIRAMLNGIPYPGLLVSREHRILAINDAAREFFQAEESKYCFEQLWHCEFLPEDQKEICKKGLHSSKMCCVFCMSDEALDTGKIVRRELFIRDHYWDSWWVPIDSSTFLHYFVDITEYKEREKRLKEAQSFLREIADTVQDMIWVKDVNKRYLFTNKAICEKLLCASDTNEPLGKTDLFFAERIRAERPDDKTWHTFGEICQDSDSIVISTGKPSRFEEFGNVRGKYLCLDVIKMPFFDENGDIIAVVGSARDITKDKELEREKELLKKRLQQSAKMEAIGIMAGGIAHNFNNLLQVITGYSQLLAQRMPAEDAVARRGLNQIRQSCERAAELVRSLMAFSRKIEYAITELNLNNEILTVQEILKNTLVKTIKLNIDLEQNLWTIKADATQLQTVLLNLANNARDAMPDGGVLHITTRNVSVQGQPEDRDDTIHSSARTSLAAGDYVLLMVSDTGCGMSEETLEHVFEPFFTTKEINKGTGLGLSSVYGIVKAYGGDIFCESTLGRGTSFAIYLPAVSRESLPIEDRSSASMEPVLWNAQIKGKTILIVDDEDAIRSLVRQALESAEYKVLEAENGEKALKLYETQSQKIDLVVLDLNMPGMSGHECLQRLLEMNRNARVLVASGYSDKGMENMVISQGATGFLSKPFKLDVLLKKIDEATAV